MDKAKEVNKVILAEEIRIQRALLKLGYYAFSIRFQSPGVSSTAPSLWLEARPAVKGDEELIGLSKSEQERLISERWFESKGVKLGG